MESPARRSAPADFTREFVAQVIAGDAVAARRFVKELTPVIHAVVARYLLRCRGVSPSAARQEVKDLVQQVFLALFEDDARVLRQWDPARGRTLRSFAGLIAEREVFTMLRSRTRSPFTEEPTERPLAAQQIDLLSPDPEETTITRQLITALVQRVKERLGDRGVHLFFLLVVEERSPEEIDLITHMTANAIYAWRSRLRQMAREFLRVATDPEVLLRKASVSDHESER